MNRTKKPENTGKTGGAESPKDRKADFCERPGQPTSGAATAKFMELTRYGRFCTDLCDMATGLTQAQADFLNAADDAAGRAAAVKAFLRLKSPKSLCMLLQCAENQHETESTRILAVKAIGSILVANTGDSELLKCGYDYLHEGATARTGTVDPVTHEKINQMFEIKAAIKTYQ